jgi:hypothetical protein
MTLRHRIMGSGANMAGAMAQARPLPSVVPSVSGLPATPHMTPMHMVSYEPNPAYPWGTATYEDVRPMWAADGAILPSTAPSAAVRTVPAGNVSPAHR